MALFLLLETDKNNVSDLNVKTTRVETLPSRSASTKEVVSVIVRGTVGPSPMMSRILKLQDENAGLRMSLADELVSDSGSVSGSYHHRHAPVHVLLNLRAEKKRKKAATMTIGDVSQQLASMMEEIQKLQKGRDEDRARIANVESVSCLFLMFIIPSTLYSRRMLR